MPSFDIVSRTNMVEVDHALQGAAREISTRYDFKGSNCAIERSENVLTIRADDEFKLKQVQELLKGHMGKRKVNIAAIDKALNNFILWYITIQTQLFCSIKQILQIIDSLLAIAIFLLNDIASSVGAKPTKPEIAHIV